MEKKPKDYTPEMLGYVLDGIDRAIQNDVRLHLRKNLVAMLDLINREKCDNEILAKVDKLRTVCANITDEDFLKYLIDEPDGKTSRDYIDEKYMEITEKGMRDHV